MSNLNSTTNTGTITTGGAPQQEFQVIKTAQDQIRQVSPVNGATLTTPSQSGMQPALSGGALGVTGLPPAGAANAAIGGLAQPLVAAPAP